MNNNEVTHFKLWVVVASHNLFNLAVINSHSERSVAVVKLFLHFYRYCYTYRGDFSVPRTNSSGSATPEWRTVLQAPTHPHYSSES